MDQPNRQAHEANSGTYPQEVRDTEPPPHWCVCREPVPDRFTPGLCFKCRRFAPPQLPLEPPAIPDGLFEAAELISGLFRAVKNEIAPRHPNSVRLTGDALVRLLNATLPNGATSAEFIESTESYDLPIDDLQKYLDLAANLAPFRANAQPVEWKL
jgi:hypothetical protein